MATKAKRNKTLEINRVEIPSLKAELKTLRNKRNNPDKILNSIIHQDYFDAVKKLPKEFIDLAFIDPPYNLTKSFNGSIFKEMSSDDYTNWVREWIRLLIPLLKETASLYICGDWRTSSIIHTVCNEEKLHTINRITFARDKGRGSNRFWKNNSEDIWFFSKSNKYYFNADAVKTKKAVIAPYRNNGKPKDWIESKNGNYRLTYPSNIWTDITIPFWSMPENTPHPTQKPEKLLAKIILASSKEGDVIFDGFAGVGTTGVVAKKLNRKYVMIEKEEEYCLFAAKRLKMAETNKKIQGYRDGYFGERNTPIK
ncbi:MAG: site-specific DNA-methyltransferase [Ignavibacteriae bacterium]|nr:site-specific DNA-methyltransferase [Ignavibacteriota bacterium]